MPRKAADHEGTPKFGHFCRSMVQDMSLRLLTFSPFFFRRRIRSPRFFLLAPAFHCRPDTNWPPPSHQIRRRYIFPRIQANCGHVIRVKKRRRGSILLYLVIHLFPLMHIVDDELSRRKFPPRKFSLTRPCAERKNPLAKQSLLSPPFVLFQRLKFVKKEGGKVSSWINSTFSSK